jgi:regulator of RNase E activity RraA
MADQHNSGLVPAVRDKLAGVSISCIANCLLRRGFRNVYMAGVRPLDASQPRLVGPAFTLRFIPAREDVDSLANYASDENIHRRAVEECPPGAVLVIDAQGCLRASSAGDLMVGRLQARGAAGIVTDGGFRDTGPMRRLGFPAYHRQPTTPATPIAMHPLELNRPIGCAGVAVYPGDVLVGDEDGIVVIPLHVVEEIAAEAEGVEDFEKFAEREIAKGRSIFGLFPPSEATRKEYEDWVARGRPGD